MQTIKLEPSNVLLTEDMRKAYLAETFAFIQTDRALYLPTTINNHCKKLLVNQINGHHEASQDELNAMMDEILFILHKENYRVPRSVYLKLMNACDWTQNHLGAYEIACFLYYKHEFIAFDVINILLRYKNEIGQANEAFDIFNATYHRLPENNNELKKELLHIEYIKSLAALKRIDEAFELCQKKIQDLYNVSYHFGKLCFMHHNQPIDVERECWKEPGLQGFCLQLAILFFQKHDNHALYHAIAIGEFLYKIRPELAKAVLALSGFYKKNRQMDKAKACLINYLDNYPNSVRVCVHYAALLIDNNEPKKAQDLCNAFIDNYTKQRGDLRKIKLLFAWFHEEACVGKSVFQELIQEFPNHPTVVYLAIRYALKLRDDAWLDELMDYAKHEFASNPELLKLIACFSQARMICAAIESHEFTQSRHILTNKPKPLLQSRRCQLPEIVVDAFQRFCSCEETPCQSHCLDNVYLVGSGVSWCLDANKSDKSFNINQLNDLDFAMQMEDIPSEPIFSGFKRNNFVLNLWTYKNPEAKHEPDIDLRLYRVKSGEQNSPDDISAMMKDRDFTINMLALNSKGLVFDWTAGEGFAAYDGHYLKIHTDALASLQHDPARVLRIVDKVVKHAYVLHPSLEKALHEFKLDSWFENARLRDKFYKLLIHPSHKALIRFMQAHSLLGLDIDASGEVEDVLRRCLRRFTDTNQQPGLLKQKKAELKQQCEQQSQQLRFLDLTEQTKQVTADIADKHAEYKKMHKSIELLQKKNNKEINKLFKEWQESDSNDNLNRHEQLKQDYQASIRSVEALRNKENLLRQSIQSTKAQSELVSKWMSAIKPSSVVNALPEFCAKRTGIEVFAVSRSWDINDLKKRLGFSSNDSFSLFISLYIGCSYLYSDDSANPLLAWYYLNLAKKIGLGCIDNSEKLEDFLNESLLPLIDLAFQSSGFESMTEDELKTQLADKTLAYDVRDAYAEYYLSSTQGLPAPVRQALLVRAFEQSNVNEFIKLYGLVLQANDPILKTHQFRQIKTSLITFFNDTCAQKTIFNELTWFTYIKNIKALCSYPNVFQQIMSNSSFDYQNGFSPDMYNFSQSRLPEAECLMNMHLAESCLILPHDSFKNTLTRATAHYQQMHDISGDDYQYGCFNLWAKLRLQWLAEEKNKVVSLSIKEAIDSLIPLFEQVVDAWKSITHRLTP